MKSFECQAKENRLHPVGNGMHLNRNLSLKQDFYSSGV